MSVCRIICAIALVFLLSSCFYSKDYSSYGSITKISEDENSSIFIYVGIGIIRVKSKPSIVNVSNTNIGFNIASNLYTRSLSIGFEDSTTTFIDTNTNSSIQVDRALFKPSEININKSR